MMVLRLGNTLVVVARSVWLLQRDQELVWVLRSLFLLLRLLRSILLLQLGNTSAIVAGAMFLLKGDLDSMRARRLS